MVCDFAGFDLTGSYRDDRTIANKRLGIRHPAAPAKGRRIEGFPKIYQSLIPWGAEKHEPHWRRSAAGLRQMEKIGMPDANAPSDESEVDKKLVGTQRG